MVATSAADLMTRFAERTGITAPVPQRRYLWTDAFAVCNFLGLDASGDDPAGRAKALAVIDAVHHTLGRHRDDDARRGWISGLDGAEAESHPTAGGLRIGKPLPERPAETAADAHREWDQDGQYFHYLTRWMHALDQAARHTGDATFNRWGRELAVTAFRAFSYVPSAGAPRRMYWKMSIDLSRPLVPAMGHHDPLDGYITCLQLSAGAKPAGTGGGMDLAPPLELEIRELAVLVSGGDWATDDPLGLGSLMTDAYRIFRIERRGGQVPPELLPALLSDIRMGLDHLMQQNTWRMPADRRLAFRELGLVIGMRALEQLHAQIPMADRRGLVSLVNPLVAQRSLAEQLTAFWLEPGNQGTATWSEHRDINEVMLATAIAPAGYIHLEA